MLATLILLAIIVFIVIFSLMYMNEKTECNSFTTSKTCINNKCHFDLESSKCMDQKSKHNNKHTSPGFV